MAVTAVDLTLGGLALLFVLIVAVAILARHDRVTRVRFGVFFERERERDDDLSEGVVRVWPKEKEEE